MKEIYVYDSDTDEWNELSEIPVIDFLSVIKEVEHEADVRAYYMLEPFEADITGSRRGVEYLRFKYMFYDWSGIIPRVIRKEKGL